ncbi:mucin-5AC-like isoform X2 [Onychostoma macrolepis]|uniref:mucin-5AC-like isoform X2 n=1 Tax=Onychostoma macrolepis TaxID=369639 RepID=UPI00272A4763|nr:mucin-5AC-like isoform X2 [Onychostoma macrolepis]
MSSTSLPKRSTTMPMVQSSSTGSSISNITITSAASSSTISSTTSTTPKSMTLSPTPGCICNWSEWINFGGPTTGPDGGEIVPIKKITETYHIICSAPKDVECRAKHYPGVPLSQLGQVVKCNVKDGLICLNKNQSLEQQCFDYEIRVFCCVGKNSSNTTHCPTTTMVSAATMSVSPNTKQTIESFFASTNTSKISTPVSSPIMPALPSTTPTLQSFSSGTSLYTTPVTSLSLSTASTTSPLSKTATHTPNPTCICLWSEWLDFGGPTTGPEGGERISIKRILDNYPTVCSAPKEVECRAKKYPRLSLSQLDQVVKCNAKDGLVCLNKYQDITHQCFDYEIRVSCCDGNCGSTTALTPKIPLFTPTIGCICQWSDWMDFGSPTTGPEGGKMISIKRITGTYPSNCSAPTELECRAKLYPELSLSQLGQVVICNAKDGLMCFNKNQDITQQCFDYEIRVLCCHGQCSSSTQAAASTRFSLSRTSTPATASSGTTSIQQILPFITSKPVTSTPECICQWSESLDFGGPTVGPEGGKKITIKKITDTYPSLCSAPKKVECHAKHYPRLSLLQLGQDVICNEKDGLLCLNKYQDNTQQCFDYNIRVLCCHGKCDNSTQTPTTPSRLPSSTTATISSTPSATYTPSKTSKPSPLIPTPPCICQWSKWLDFGRPTKGPEGGKHLPVKIITDTYPTSCSIPQAIECRAKLYPRLPVSQLGQVVKCNLKDGLVCLNKKQNISQQCFDYEMRLLCCHRDCVSATLPAALTLALYNSSTSVSTTTVPPTRAMNTTISKTSPSKCICQWSDWMDFGSPTTGPEGGEIIPINAITNAYLNISSAPTEVECHAKLYPGLLLSQLGQVVTCNSEDGLVCLNKNQGVTQQCFDYEIKILHCHGLCGISSKITQTNQYFSNITIITTRSLPIITGSTGGHITANQDCVCEMNGNTFKPGNCDKHMPPLKNGESIHMGNCSIGTCINGTMERKAVHCDPVQYPVCKNKFPPLKVADESGCCFKYECQCICNGFHHLHYITFDGIYYPFQGNLTNVLVKEIDPKFNFSVVVDNVLCDSEDASSPCPKSLTVRYKYFEIFMSLRISGGTVMNLIYVNQKKVKLPFENKEFRATENGTASLVVISEIDAHISFTGTMFSIHLPWQKFHGNTEGQCGVCDNNQRNDCRLPNGTIISSCQDMAPYWHVHNKNNNNNNVLSPRPESISKPCPSSAICKIMERKLFEKCHKFVPFEPYMSACNSDVCKMNNKAVGCARLQAYARECAMAGVCVDWRGLTNGVCDFKCDKPQTYKACGPQVESTCDGRFNLNYLHGNNAFRNQESMLWEGCYCPSGTTRVRPNSNVCVASCKQAALKDEILGSQKRGAVAEISETHQNKNQHYFSGKG